LMGTWTKPGLEKELKYLLTPKDTILKSIDTSMNPVAVTGEYAYQFGKSGATGDIDIKHLEGRNYLMAITCVTGPPAYNVAEVDATKVQMFNNTIIYNVRDGDCKFKIRAFRDFIVIDWISRDIQSCGFGLNASIDGVFIKTSEKTKFN